MKNQQKRKVLRVYEKTIVNACATRKEAINKAQADFEAIRDKAKETYREAIRAVDR